MRRWYFTGSIVAAILFIMSTPAMAETVLVSSPLPPGEGGHNCACTNLTKNTIEVEFNLVYTTGYTYLDRTIQSGNADSFAITSTAYTRLCRIIRGDGKTVKEKDLACTLSAIDANGNPTAVVPVNLKFKR